MKLTLKEQKINREITLSNWKPIFQKKILSVSPNNKIVNSFWQDWIPLKLRNFIPIIVPIKQGYLEINIFNFFGHFYGFIPPTLDRVIDNYIVPQVVASGQLHSIYLSRAIPLTKLYFVNLRYNFLVNTSIWSRNFIKL